MRLRPVALTLLAAGLLSACPPSTATCQVDEDCKLGWQCCGGTCVDAANDSANCGACGTVCEFPNSAPTCRSGFCQLQCQTGFGNCNGQKADGCEADFAQAVDACGACGKVCSPAHATPACLASRCAVSACASGYADCDQAAATGCEVDLLGDVQHCGACGTPCLIANGTGACDAGTCQVAACDAGAGDCDVNPATGCEAVLATDARHCGRCGAGCDAQQACVDGRCWAGQLIVFGGLPNFSGAPPIRDVYRFDLDGGVFTRLSPATPGGAPPVRSHHAVAWDVARDRLLVWGGVDGTGAAVAADVWALEFTADPPVWRKVVTSGTAPPPRTGPAFAVDDAAGQLYVFGGTTDTGAGRSDLSRFDFATDTWVALHGDDAAGAPTSRVNASGAFDPALRRFVVFGGSNASTRVDFGELWEFDVALSAWRAPPRTGGAVPRGLGALYGGPPLHLFSGVAGLLGTPATVTEFAWLDLAGAAPWQQVSPAGPAARFNAAAAEHGGALYLFGGAAVGGTGPTLTPDLWRYEVATQSWSHLFDGTGVAPPGTFAARMVAR